LRRLPLRYPSVTSQTQHQGDNGMSSLHILVLTDRDWTHPQGGGTGTNLFGQVTRWTAWGHRVTVIASSYPGAPGLDRVGPVTIHRIGGRSTVFPRTILRQIRRLVPDADVVLEIINGITFLTPLWLRTPRVALIHHIHRHHYVEEMGVRGKLAAWTLETAPLRVLYGNVRFMTVSNASAAGIAALGVPRDRIHVVHNGVESEAFGPGDRAPEPRLLYLGRLKRYKHVEDLLGVVEAVPGAHLDIAGDGDQRGPLEAEIRLRGLEDRVTLHGHVDEQTKRELLQRAWVNLSASTAEGWCLTTMEAAACGTPSVALGVGGIPEAVLHERTGLLARNVDELKEHARRVVEDDDLRDRLGTEALARAREFTWDRTAAHTLAVLRSEAKPALRTPPVITTPTPAERTVGPS
jgi:glycosyltransferase involved in cell wall biosynthesis